MHGVCASHCLLFQPNYRKIYFIIACSREISHRTMKRHLNADLTIKAMLAMILLALCFTKRC